MIDGDLDGGYLVGRDTFGCVIASLLVMPLLFMTMLVMTWSMVTWMML